MRCESRGKQPSVWVNPNLQSRCCWDGPGEAEPDLVGRVGPVDQGRAQDGFVGLREGVLSDDLHRAGDVEVQVPEDNRLIIQEQTISLYFLLY